MNQREANLLSQRFGEVCRPASDQATGSDWSDGYADGLQHAFGHLLDWCEVSVDGFDKLAALQSFAIGGGLDVGAVGTMQLTKEQGT